MRLATRPQAWSRWFQAQGEQAPGSEGMVFEQLSIIAQAAAAGLGVALLPRFLIQSELDRGELVLLSDTPLADESGYYLVSPRDRADYAPLVALRQWLLEQVAGEPR